MLIDANYSFYILFHFENKYLMFKICIEAIDNRQVPMIKQIMLKFPHFLELYHYLPEQDFTLLLNSLEYWIVGKHQSLIIESDRLYFFLGVGVILHKQILSRTQKNIRIHQKTQAWRSKTCNRVEIKQTSSYEIRQFDSYEDITNNNYRQSENTFFNSSMQTALIISMDSTFLEEPLLLKLQSLYHQKLKCLQETNFFRPEERHLIQQHLHKFQFMHLKFNQFLYKNNKDSTQFFIKKGAVEVVEFLEGKQIDVRRVYGCCALGFDKKKEESAKCISSFVHCYVINKVTIENILSKKHTHISKRNKTVGWQFPLVKTPSIQSSRRELQSDRHPVNEESSNVVESFIKTDSLAAFTKKKYNHKSLISSRVNESIKKRRDQLRQHFSNFYNQAYNQFSENKVKQMGLKMEDKQNLVLYKIKIMQKKAPDMEAIRHKLQKIKFEKIRKCIEHLSNRKHITEVKNQQ